MLLFRCDDNLLVKGGTCTVVSSTRVRGGGGGGGGGGGLSSFLNSHCVGHALESI